jgi:hypothetical protein
MCCSIQKPTKPYLSKHVKLRILKGDTSEVNQWRNGMMEGLWWPTKEGVSCECECNHVRSCGATELFRQWVKIRWLGENCLCLWLIESKSESSHVPFSLVLSSMLTMKQTFVNCMCRMYSLKKIVYRCWVTTIYEKLQLCKYPMACASHLSPGLCCFLRYQYQVFLARVLRTTFWSFLMKILWLQVRPHSLG